MKGTKGKETKALIREAAFKLFLTKGYNMVPLKEIEQSLNLSRGCTIYHYPTKQDLLVDVINFYILDTSPIRLRSAHIRSMSLLEYLNRYVDNIEEKKEKLTQFVIPEANTNGARAYMNLVLQAEKHYPGFHQLLDEIEKSETAQLKQAAIKAQEEGEIRKTCDIDLFVRQIRLTVLGKSYQDALRNGLDTHALREQFIFLYSLIRNDERNKTITYGKI